MHHSGNIHTWEDTTFHEKIQLFSIVLSVNSPHLLCVLGIPDNRALQNRTRLRLGGEISPATDCEPQASPPPYQIHTTVSPTIFLLWSVLRVERKLPWKL